ncbi:MAG: hypothetical protein GXP25_12205 [Planctomycetes bacterium]|nr:hypothetical protein [Planctomycetota bacterium]
MAQDASEKKEALSQEILDNARKQAKRKIDRAEREAQRIRDEAEADGRKEADAIRDKAHKRAEMEKTRIGATIPLEVKRRTLAAEEKILDSVLEHALHAAAAKKNPVKALKALILDAVLVIHENQMSVEANEEDSGRITEDMLNEVAEEVKKQQGRSVTLTPSGERPPILGGVIVRSGSGRLICDNSLEARLARRRDDLRLKLSRILFDEEEDE